MVLQLPIAVAMSLNGMRSSAIAMEREFVHLGPPGTHAFGWIAQDLHPDGAVGDAGKATAKKGTSTAEHQIAGFIALLRDMTKFSLSRLHAAERSPASC